MTLRSRFIPVLAIAVGFLCGCDSKPTHESVLKDSIAKLQDLTTVLEGVKDESSAQAAKPKLQAISADLKELRAKSDKLGKPSPDEEKRLRDKYQPQVKELTPKLFSEMMRVAMDPKLGPIVKDSLPNESPAASGPLGM